jgi:hypothetical protein
MSEDNSSISSKHHFYDMESRNVIRRYNSNTRNDYNTTTTTNNIKMLRNDPSIINSNQYVMSSSSSFLQQQQQQYQQQLHHTTMTFPLHDNNNYNNTTTTDDNTCQYYTQSSDVSSESIKNDNNKLEDYCYDTSVPKSSLSSVSWTAPISIVSSLFKSIFFPSERRTGTRTRSNRTKQYCYTTTTDLLSTREYSISDTIFDTIRIEITTTTSSLSCVVVIVKKQLDI